MAKDLNEWKKQILEDGDIDADEVKAIEAEIYDEEGDEGADISRAEANFLMDLNNEATNKDASWEPMYVKAITTHVLADEVSPGEVDDEEAEWLIEKIGEDGDFDDTEKALVVNIINEATAVSDKLVDFAKQGGINVETE
jgi:hypothetical protein